uniref:translation machinery-associated protein 7B-like n=1 Tax=Nyctereutes procyonoides TaxID=34880 RepID=UPI00244376C3|nr:translation machinery-associated protein 7B-like [Nyctereutes procyonoides]
MSSYIGSKKQPLKQPKEIDKIRNSSRKGRRVEAEEKEKQEKLEELKAKVMGKSPLVTGGIKKSGKK